MTSAPALLLVVAVLQLLTVGVSAQPAVVSIHVSPSGADGPLCGASPATACLSLRGALDQLPPAGASILLADGTYSGVNNTNIELQPSPPLRIAAANAGAGRVVLDAEGAAGRRHFTLLMGTNSSVLPPSSSRIDIEGLTLRGGRASLAGSILVQGDGVNLGATVRISDCVFQQNSNPAGPQVDSAGAVFVSKAVLPGSLQSVQQQPAMVPPGPPANPMSVISANGKPPVSPYGSATWTDAPPLPQLEEDGGTFRPAVIFRGCVFERNSFVPVSPLTGAYSAGSLAVHGSVVALLGCSFRLHTAPSYLVMLLTGVGGTWVDRSTFEQGAVSSIGVTVVDVFIPQVDSAHNLLVSRTNFTALSAQDVPLSFMADLLGKQIGTAITHFGYSSVTLIDTLIDENSGTALSIGAVGLFRMFGGAISRAVSMVDSLVNLPAATSAIFSRTSFTDNGHRNRNSGT